MQRELLYLQPYRLINYKHLVFLLLLLTALLLYYPHQANGSVSPVIISTTTPPDLQTPWIEALAQCESGGDPTIKVLDTNGLYSYGYLQFQLETFEGYAHVYHIEGSIYSKEVQMNLARHMLDDGLWRNWLNCGTSVMKKLGSYPPLAQPSYENLTIVLPKE